MYNIKNLYAKHFLKGSTTIQNNVKIIQQYHLYKTIYRKRQARIKKMKITAIYYEMGEY